MKHIKIKGKIISFAISALICLFVCIMVVSGFANKSNDGCKILNYTYAYQTSEIQEYTHDVYLAHCENDIYIEVPIGYSKSTVKLKDSAENIYRTFIRDYGVREHILVKTDAVATMKEKWKKQGIGWFVEELRPGKVENTTTLVLYYGSSIYNSVEMIRLIDAVIEECEQQGIPTMTHDEIKKLKNEND